MRWLFSKNSSSQRALVENKLEIKKKPLLWSLLCTRKRPSFTVKRPFQENVDNQKSRRVQQHRKSRILNKFDTNRFSSSDSLSSGSGNYEEVFKRDDLIVPTLNQCSKESPIAFCPNCHTNVVPLYEKVVSDSNHAILDNKVSVNESIEVSNEYTLYESVYKDIVLPIDKHMKCELNENTEFQPVEKLLSSVYFLPTEPLAFSTIDRKAIHFDDSKTIYDEVASESEEDSSSGYYDSLHFVVVKQSIKTCRKRSAYPESDSYQQMKRMRREVFVCEE
ncbi:unnamed protein product [Schistosoma turkestanicum]|nr:unnamed protein product [Schistosoma turkestanicum]